MLKRFVESRGIFYVYFCKWSEIKDKPWDGYKVSDILLLIIRCDDRKIFIDTGTPIDDGSYHPPNLGGRFVSGRNVTTRTTFHAVVSRHMKVLC